MPSINLSTLQLINYTLHLADNTLILAQRNAEWCGHGPILEQDIAITNISLDLLGQSRNFYQYAASLINQSTHQSENIATEDSLAYLRTEREFKNFLLVEQPNGDWGQTILRQFFFSAYQQLLYKKLKDSSDEQLAAIAIKSLKEVNYHVRWSREWVIRLGDGTEESRIRIVNAIQELWRYTGELFMTSDYEEKIFEQGIGVNSSSLKNEWLAIIAEVFKEANLSLPENIFMQRGGREGIHTEHLGFILTELQYMQRVYPGATW
ncbi:MAG: 1,2-phenylacetyl-CoA epoxidase subunit PaaC [Chitinophagaceae bacterium]